MVVSFDIPFFWQVRRLKFTKPVLQLYRKKIVGSLGTQKMEGICLFTINSCEKKGANILDTYKNKISKN